MPLELHFSNLSSLAIGRRFFSLNDDDVSRFINWSNEKIYLTTPENGEMPTWDWLFNKFKEQQYAYGVDIFVIDAFNKLDFTDNKNHIQNINRVLGKLTMFAQMHNVIIFLIAHPTKMKKKEDGTYDEPSLYDVSGSADFRNQTHDGFCIYRFFGNNTNSGYTTFRNNKVKYNFQGEIGDSETFFYDHENGRFYPSENNKCTIDFTLNAFTQEAKEVSVSDFRPPSNFYEVEEDKRPF
jgi:twinkle protein